jgi:hypothetical protein
MLKDKNKMLESQLKNVELREKALEKVQIIFLFLISIIDFFRNLMKKTSRWPNLLKVWPISGSNWPHCQATRLRLAH